MAKQHFHIKQGDQFEVKELFKDFGRLIHKHFHGKVKDLDILDVGCASGELSVYLKRELNQGGKAKGLDISQDLIANAKERFVREDVEFMVADAGKFSFKDRFDVLTMTSVLSYFTEPLPVVANMLAHLKPGGIIIISGLFNPWDMDVRMQYRYGDDPQWYSPLNQFSMRKISGALEAKGWKATFSEQVMPFTIEPKEHPARSWTVDLNDKRHMMCGLQLVYNIQILTIVAKESA